MQEDSLQCAKDVYNDDGDEEEQKAYVNNDFVILEDAHPDEIVDEQRVESYATDILSFDDNRDMSMDEHFVVGQIFPSKEKLIQALREWSVRRSVAFKTIKSTTTKYTVKCASSGNVQCLWRLHASVSRQWEHAMYFTIKKYHSEHTCRNCGSELDNLQVTSKFICSVILPALKQRLDMTPAVIQDHIKIAYHRDISYFKAWDARKKALCKLFGDWESSYRTLPQYLDAISLSNTGTVYHITHEDSDGQYARFTGVFWAFGPSIEGFKYCRPVLSIDGTHLYGKYPGHLLVATGIDADGGLYPLAFAVVSGETSANWEWFFTCIRLYIPSVRVREITWISDRMKGLPRALAQGWQEPHYHRYCMRHIRANFSTKFKDKELQNLLYAAGCTNDPLEYNALRSTIREKCLDADGWINSSLGPNNEDRWALCRDGGKRFCIMTTNCSESFNGVLKGARALPIQSLIARTFYRLNKYFVTRREKAENWKSRFTPKNEQILQERGNAARVCTLRRYAVDNWEVVDKNGNVYDVHLDGGGCHCTCNVPLLQKIPCIHVIKACTQSYGGANISYENYCSSWYATENYVRSYAPRFRPIPDDRHWVDRWEGPIILPPDIKRKKGRPQSTRLKGEMDYQGREGAKTNYKCSLCKSLGHNRARCPNAR